MTVSNSVKKDGLKYDDIRDLILSEKVRRRDTGIDNLEEQALVIKNRGRSRSNERNDWVTFNDRSKSRDRDQFKETRECFHCGRKGHIRMNCWHLKKKKKPEDKEQKNDDEKDTTTVVTDEGVVGL